MLRKCGKTYGHYKKYGPKGTIPIGERKEAHIIEKNGGSWRKEVQGKSCKLMNKELISVGYMIGSNVASWSKHGRNSWWVSSEKTSLKNLKKEVIKSKGHHRNILLGCDIDVVGQENEAFHS